VTGRVRTFFDLVRLPNLFTAAADILAGFLYAGGLLGDWAAWLPLAIASMCLYAGGVALNDVCDAARDCAERSRRPIPSGRISRRGAGLIAGAFLLVGVGLACSCGLRSVAIAFALVVSIVLYDWVLKRTPIAPVMMGMCRGLNLSLGMMPAADLFVAPMLVPIGLFVLYVASLTLFARCEAGVGASDRLRLFIATAGGAVAFGLFFVLPSFSVGVVNPSRVGVLVGIGGVLVVGIRAALNPSPARVQQGVKMLIVLLVWFDVCLAWAGAGWVAGVAVASLILPTLLLGRLFRMT
jgi:UbiA prenyltransferase family